MQIVHYLAYFYRSEQYDDTNLGLNSTGQTSASFSPARRSEHRLLSKGHAI